MSQANAYKNLVASRKQKPDPAVVESIAESVIPLLETDPVLPLPPEVIAPIQKPVVSNPEIPPMSRSSVQSPSSIIQPQSKKRGRPATGKRSDEAWIGRTYYVQRETDLDVEDYLLKLKRQGIEIDKSELVDFMLAAWTKWQKGENIDILLDEFSPRRKSD